MVQLTLSQEEAKTLKNVLTSYISDLRMEIVDTEEHGFRESLKKEEVVLKKILDSLGT